MGIKAFINAMDKDLSGPNFNQSEVETVEALAKRAKKRLFGATKNDTKDIAKSLLEGDEQKGAEEPLNKAEREAKNSNTTGNLTEGEVGVSMKEMKDKLNAESESAEKDLENTERSTCEVTKEIEKKIEAIIPPPPKPTPPPPIIEPPVTKTVDTRTEIEKAYDRASDAIAEKAIQEEEMKEEQAEKISEMTNKTVKADEDVNGNKLAKKAEKEEKMELKDQEKKKKSDKEEEKKIQTEIKKKIKEEDNKKTKEVEQIKKEK